MSRNIMTQQDKELLLKDLCARLPYGVKVLCRYYCEEGEDEPQEDIFILNEVDNRSLTNPFWIGGEQIRNKGFGNGTSSFAVCIDDEDAQFIKPYLRPMSSMTEEEKKEYKSLFNEHEEEYNQGCNFFYSYTVSMYDHQEIGDIIDWLNAHHFDYRGLIGKGLALEAPDGMYICQNIQKDATEK